jgi:hypothetical protein
MSDRSVTRWQEITQALSALDLEQRDEARATALQRATEQVAGQQPDRKVYMRADVGQWPGWLFGTVIVLLLLVFVSGGFITLVSVFTAGRNEFSQTMPSYGQQAEVVGFFTFMLAEFTVVVSVMAWRVLFKKEDLFQRIGMVLAVVFGLAVSLTGNWVTKQPHDWWSLLLTLTPPFMVLVTALIFEALVLQSVRTRHARRKAYEAKLHEWEDKVRHIEATEPYRQAWASALKAAIIANNDKGAGAKARKELMEGLTRAEWSALVWREMQEDDWFSEELLTNFTGPSMETAHAAASPNGQHG